MKHLLNTRRAVIAALLTAVLLASCSGSNDRPSLDEGTAVPPATATSAEETPSPTTEAGSLASEDGFVAIEEFGQSGRLDELVTTLGWTTPLGAWTVNAGTVALAESPGLAPAIAFTGLGASDGLIQVTLTQVASGAGLIFRYVDVQNYWAVTAVPGFVTWNVTKVVDGRPSIVANLGVAPVDPNTTIGVILEGDQIVVLANGRPYATLRDDDLIDGQAAGLFAAGPDALPAQWDDFLVIAVRAGIEPPPPFSLPTPDAGGAVPSPTTPADPSVPTPTPTPFGSAAAPPTATPTQAAAVDG